MGVARHGRQSARSAIVAAVVLASCLPAYADALDRIIRLTPGDNALARTATIHRYDVTEAGLGPSQLWRGGVESPSLRSTQDCPKPRSQIGTVETGAAESRYTRTGFQLESEAVVLETTTMTRRDLDADDSGATLDCIRADSKRGLPASQRVISVRRLSTSPLTFRSVAFMIVLRYTIGSTGQYKFFEFVIAARGRLELEVSAFGPLESSAAGHRAIDGLAKKLLSRS